MSENNNSFRLYSFASLILLFLFYKYISIENFSYEGYGTELIDSKFTYFLFFLVLSLVLAGNSNPFHIFYFLFIICPALILYIYTDSIEIKFIFNIYIIQLSWLIMDYAFGDFTMAQSSFAFGLKMKIFILISLVLSCILTVYSFGVGSVLNIFSYELRAEHYLNVDPFIVRFINFSSNFLALYIFILINKKFPYSALLISLGVALFFASAMSKKEPLFLIPFFIIYVIYNKLIGESLNHNAFAKNIFIFSFLSIIAVSNYFYYFFDDILVPSTLIRRMLLLPILIGSEWFNYADHFGFSFFRASDFFDTHKYDIADSMGKYGSGANVGIIGTAYDYLGWTGVIASGFFINIYARILYLFLCGLSYNHKLNIIICCLIIYQILISSAFTTFLFTHGGLFPVLFVFISLVLKLWARYFFQAERCIDRVNCSGVIFEGNTDERTDGRPHQTLHGQA